MLVPPGESSSAPLTFSSSSAFISLGCRPLLAPTMHQNPPPSPDPTGFDSASERRLGKEKKRKKKSQCQKSGTKVKKTVKQSDKWNVIFALLNPALRRKDAIIHHSAKGYCPQRLERSPRSSRIQLAFSVAVITLVLASHKQHLVGLPLTVTCCISLVSSSLIETDRQPLDFNKPG